MAELNVVELNHDSVCKMSGKKWQVAGKSWFLAFLRDLGFNFQLTWDLTERTEKLGMCTKRRYKHQVKNAELDKLNITEITKKSTVSCHVSTLFLHGFPGISDWQRSTSLNSATASALDSSSNSTSIPALKTYLSTIITCTRNKAGFIWKPWETHKKFRG